MIAIDLEDIFELIEIGEDISFTTFYSPIENQRNILIRVEISPHYDPLLPNVFNLAFGPLNEQGGIDDNAKVPHHNINKVFSTILFIGLLFLRKKPNSTLGVDGSDEIRAYLYHRMFQTNRDYLSEYFVSIGVDWYVRLLRSGDVERNTENFPFFKPRPEPFDYHRSTQDLYRYYMFYLKK